jgi:hypothetical protein
MTPRPDIPPSSIPNYLGPLGFPPREAEKAAAA